MIEWGRKEGVLGNVQASNIRYGHVAPPVMEKQELQLVHPSRRLSFWRAEVEETLHVMAKHGALLAATSLMNQATPGYA